MGRHSSNSVQLEDLTVSRHHCVLRPSEGGFVVADLDSRHGTFVNGAPIRERSLAHGDSLHVGKSMFVFLAASEEPAERARSLVLSDEAFTADTTQELALAEARYLQPEWIPPSSEPPARTAKDLQTLLGVSRAMSESRDVDHLARRFLELLAEAVPAERLALTLQGAAEEDRVFTHAGGDPAAPGGPIVISRTLAKRVRERRSAVLCNDVRAELSDSESLQSSHVSSLICSPLDSFDRPLGLVYADNFVPNARFDEGHLELMTAAAAIAGAAFAHAIHLEWLEEENRRLRAAPLEHGMIGESPAMRRVYEFLARVGPTDSTVLLRGESGTGKELAARALHTASPRGGRFVAINCATLSEHLLESELFGHEKGAFTGAVARKVGKLELAHRGTVFLDEVGEIPTGLQAKLLRALEERRFERVGGTEPIEVDLRVIAATNRDLEAAIRQGTFRSDLFYRLNVIALEMPPLRERREDIPLLASHCAARYSQRLKRPIAGLSPEARGCLLAYDWPGNVRELANAIERAVVLGRDDVIRAEDLPEAVVEARSAHGAPPTTYHARLTAAKRRLIKEALAAAGGNVTRAAEKLGLHPNYLHRMITNLGMRDELED